MDNLRDYQREAVDKAVHNLRRPTKPFIIVAATGAGKSHIIAGICEELAETPVLVLQPSKEILEQNYQKLVLADPMIQVGIYSASKGRKEIQHVTFATIGSIRTKPEQFKKFKVVVLDECHLLNPKKDDGMLTKFFKDIDCQHVVGLTATPYRTDVLWTRESNGDLTSTASLKMINRISRTPFFKSIAYKIETKELQDRGYLAPIKYFLEPSDWSQLRINSTGADFEATSAEKWAWRRVERITDAIRYADGHTKRSLTFCATIEQANEVADNLGDEGITAKVVTGTTPLKEREQLIADFKAGVFKHMLNVGVFTTGFDVPVLDCIILGKPTMSLSLYYQMVGRGIRIDPDDPNKVLQVYDLSGVVERLGRVETIRVTTEKGGFRDEVWSEVGRCDGFPLYSFTVTPKEKAKGVKRVR